MIRVFRHHVSGLSILFGVLEVLLLLTLAGLLWEYRIHELIHIPDGTHYLGYAALSLAIFIVAIFSALGLYNREVIVDRRVMFFRLALAISAIIATAGTIIYLYMTSAPLTKYPRLVDAAMAMAILIAVPVAARWGLLLVSKSPLFRRNVVILGAGVRAAELRRLIANEAAPRFDVVKCIGLEDEPDTVPSCARIQRGAANENTLLDLLRGGEVDEIIVTPDNRRGLPVDSLLRCKMMGVRVTEPLTFVERELGRINPDELQGSWLIFSDGFNFSAFGDAAKRLFDIAVSVLFLLFTLPLTLITALLIKVDSRGPVFYLQERVGLHGRPFMLIKFRSMRLDAEADGAPQWAKKNDDRITRVGAIIRRTRIDEIPQVLNVLRGDMSLVGPRPERPFFVDSLQREIPYYGERHCAKPGITGWAQINYPYGSSTEDAKEKLSYDLYYVKNRSLFLDIIILLQTVRVIFWPAGVR